MTKNSLGGTYSFIMTPQDKRRVVQAKRAKARERDELLLKETGAGISDLCLGAVTKYAPRLAFTENERRSRIARHRGIGHAFLPYYQLVESPSEECLDALAVWHPLPLRHLLSLDAKPRQNLLDARTELASSRARANGMDAWMTSLPCYGARRQPCICSLQTKKSAR